MPGKQRPLHQAQPPLRNAQEVCPQGMAMSEAVALHSSNHHMLKASCAPIPDLIL